MKSEAGRLKLYTVFHSPPYKACNSGRKGGESDPWAIGKGEYLNEQKVIPVKTGSCCGLIGRENM